MPSEGQRAASRHRLVQIAHLLSGNAGTVVLGLASTTVAARALGPAAFGVLALTISYTQAIERFVSFQSWQPMIRYGAGLSREAEGEQLRQLLKFCLVLDLGGAAAGWLVAVGVAIGGQALLGWSAETLKVVLLYSSVLLFSLAGVPTGVLRIAGLFRTAAYVQVASGGVRLAACCLAALTGAGLLGFTLVWTATQIVSSLATLAVALVALRREGLLDMLNASLAGVTARFPGLWRFTWSTNVSLTLWSSTQQLDTLMVGALAGPAQAGLYHIAKRVARLAQQVGLQVQAVVYPEMSRLWARGAVADFGRVVAEVETMLAAFGALGVLAMLVLAEPALRLTAGPAFTAAAPMLVAQTVAVALTISGSVTRSALLAMGCQRDVLRIVGLATLVFHLSAVVLVLLAGAVGANIAHILLGVIWLAGLTILFRKRLRAAGPQGAGAPDAEPGLAAE